MNDKKNKTGSGQKQTEEMLGQIIENSRDIYYKFDLTTGRYVFISSASIQFSGFSQAEFIAMGPEQVFQRIHPEDRQKMDRSFVEKLEHKKNTTYEWTIEYRFLCKDEKYRWLSDNRTICFDEDGIPVALIGNARDITESRKLQTLLAQSEQKYRQLFDNSRAALFISRAEDGKVLECNQMLASMFGYETCEQCIADFVSSERFIDPEARPKIMEQIYKHGYVEDFQTEVIRRDGSTIWANFSVRLLPEQGILEGVAMDITNIKKLTPAERNVLELVMKGFSNKQIARRMKRSVRTIEDHRASIMQKFEVHNLVELARTVLEKGFIQ